MDENIKPAVLKALQTLRFDGNRELREAVEQSI